MNQTRALSQILEAVRAEIDTVACALARRCALAGRLDPGLLDEAQLACFELAWARAEWVAASCAVDAFAESDSLGCRLVSTFAVDVLPALLGRLDALHLELGMASDGVRALTDNPDLRELRRALTSSPALNQTAVRVALERDQIATVSMAPELELLQQQFARFGVEQVAPVADRIHREDLTVPETLLQPLRELGVFGLSIPERYGGSGGDERNDLAMIVATEALSEASLGAAGSLITRPEILGRALLEGGTEGQRRRWLPAIAQGDPLCAIAITEPDFGSDVANLNLRGARVPGGWRLDGAKTWCTFAGKAGVVMVVVRTDPDRSRGHRGLSLMLAEKPSFEGQEFSFVQEGGGRLIGRAIPTLGYRGMHSFELSFQGFFVPDANVIGEEAGLGKGFYYTMAGLLGGRLQTAARACGVMHAALLAGIRYAEERKVFGAALMNYPLTGARISRAAARYAAARLLTFRVGRGAGNAQARSDASLAKLFACRAAELVTREMQQLHGGMGYAEEMPVSRYFVDARVLSIFEGAEEALALKVIARDLLEGAMEGLE